MRPGCATSDADEIAVGVGVRPFASLDFLAFSWKAETDTEAETESETDTETEAESEADPDAECRHPHVHAHALALALAFALALALENAKRPGKPHNLAAFHSLRKGWTAHSVSACYFGCAEWAKLEASVPSRLSMDSRHCSRRRRRPGGYR